MPEEYNPNKDTNYIQRPENTADSLKKVEALKTGFSIASDERAWKTPSLPLVPNAFRHTHLPQIDFVNSVLGTKGNAKIYNEYYSGRENANALRAYFRSEYGSIIKTMVDQNKDNVAGLLAIRQLSQSLENLMLESDDEKVVFNIVDKLSDILRKTNQGIPAHMAINPNDHNYINSFTESIKQRKLDHQMIQADEGIKSFLKGGLHGAVDLGAGFIDSIIDLPVRLLTKEDRFTLVTDALKAVLPDVTEAELKSMSYKAGSMGAQVGLALVPVAGAVGVGSKAMQAFKIGAIFGTPYLLREVVGIDSRLADDLTATGIGLHMLSTSKYGKFQTGSDTTSLNMSRKPIRPLDSIGHTGDFALENPGANEMINKIAQDMYQSKGLQLSDYTSEALGKDMMNTEIMEKNDGLLSSLFTDPQVINDIGSIEPIGGNLAKEVLLNSQADGIPIDHSLYTNNNFAVEIERGRAGVYGESIQKELTKYTEAQERALNRSIIEQMLGEDADIGKTTSINEAQTASTSNLMEAVEDSIRSKASDAYNTVLQPVTEKLRDMNPSRVTKIFDPIVDKFGKSVEASDMLNRAEFEKLAGREGSGSLYGLDILVDKMKDYNGIEADQALSKTNPLSLARKYLSDAKRVRRRLGRSGTQPSTLDMVDSYIAVLGREINKMSSSIEKALKLPDGSITEGFKVADDTYRLLMSGLDDIAKQSSIKKTLRFSAGDRFMDMSASEQNKIIKNSMRAMDDFLINNELYSKGHTLTELSSAPDTQYIADATLFDRMATYKNAQIAEILNNAGVKYVNAEIQPGTNYTKLTKLADDIAKFGSEYQKMVAQDVVKMANNKLYTLAEAKKSSPAKNIVSVIAKVSSKYKLSKVFGIDALLNKLVFEGTSGGVGVDAKYIIHNTLADGIINK